MNSQNIPAFEETTEYVPSFNETAEYAGPRNIPLLKRVENLKPLFQGVDKVTDAFSPLERIKVGNILKNYDNQDEMKMKLANTMFLSSRTNTDPDIVFNSYDSFSKTYFNKELSVSDAYKRISETLNTKNPFNADKLNAIQQGLKNYSEKNVTGNLERSVEPFQKQGSEIGSNVGKSVKADFLNVVGSMEQLPLITHDLLNDAGAAYYNTMQNLMDSVFGVETTERFLYSNELPYSSAGAWLEKNSQEKLKAAEELRGQYTNGKSIIESFKESPAKGMEQLLYGVTGNMLTLGAQTAITAANPIAGVTFMGGIASGGKYAETKTDEAMSPMGVYVNTIGSGIAEGVFEYTFSNPLIKGMIGKSGKELKRGFVNGGVQILKGTGQEGIEEGLTQVSQNFLDLITNKGGADYKKMSREQIFEYLSNGVPDSIMVGGVLGGGMAAVGRYRQLSFAQRDKVDAELITVAERMIEGFNSKSVLTEEEKSLQKILSENISNPEKLLRETGKIYLEQQPEEIKYITKDEGLTKEEISDFIDEVPHIINEKGHQNKATYELENIDRAHLVKNVQELSDDFLEHTYNNPINNKFGHKVYFEPDIRSVERLGPRKAFIEYVLHIFTGTKKDKDFNTREMKGDKLKDAGYIMDTAKNPDGYSVESEKVYYYRKIKENNYSVLVLRNEKKGLAIEELRFVTHLPRKSQTFVNKMGSAPPVNPMPDGLLTEQTNGDSVSGIADIINQNPENVNLFHEKILSGADKIANEALERIKERHSGGRLKDITQVAVESVEDIIDLSIIGAAKMTKGVVKFQAWSKEMLNEFGEKIKPHLNEIYGKSKDFFNKIKEKTGTRDSNSKYVNDLIDMFDDPMYADDKDSMQWDSRVIRVSRIGEKEEIAEALDFLEEKALEERSSQKPDARLLEEIDGMIGSVSKALAAKSENIYELRKSAKKERIERKKEIRKKQKEALKSFEAENREIEESKKRSEKEAERTAKSRESAKARENKYQDWLMNTKPLLWTIEAEYGGKIRPSERFRGEEERLSGSSYIDFKDGFASDKAAEALGMDEESLIEALSGVKKRNLRNEFAEFQRMEKEQLDYDMKNDPEAQGFDEVEKMLRGAKREAFREGYKSGYKKAEIKSRNETAEKLSDIQARFFRNIDDIKTVQKELTEFINKRLPMEKRGKFINKIAMLSEASMKPTKKNPFGSRRVLLDAVVSQINDEAVKVQRDKLLEGIYQMLDRSGVEKDKKGIPKGKFTPEIQSEIDRIREIAELPTEKLNERIENVSAMLENAENLDEAARLKDELASLSLFGNLEKKSYEELIQAFNDLQSLYKNGRTEHWIMIEREKAEKRMLIEQSMNEVTGGKGLMSYADERNQRAESENAFRRAVEAVKGGLNSLKSFEFLLNTITRRDKSSGHLGSSTVKHFSSLAQDATLKKNTELREKSEERDAKLKEIFKASGIKLEKKLYAFSRSVIQNSGVFVNEGVNLRESTVSLDEAYKILNSRTAIEGLTPETMADIRRQLQNPGKRKTVTVLFASGGTPAEIPLTQGEALGLHLMYMQEDLRQAFQANGYNSETMRQIDNFLSPEAKELGNWLMEQYENEYGAINDVFKKLYFVNLPQIENYSPATFDVEKDTEQSGMIDGPVEGFVTGAVKPGALITRQKHKRRPKPVDALLVYNSHLEQMTHFKAWAEAVNDMRSVLGNADVKKAVRQYAGASALEMLNFKIKAMADGGNVKAQTIRVFDALRRNFAVSKLAFNIGSSIKQLTAYPAYAAEIPMADFLKYQAEFITDPIGHAQEMLDLDYVKNRFGGGFFDRDVMAAMRSFRGKGGYSKRLAQAGMIGTRLGDIISVTLGGYSVYKYNFNKAVKEGKSEAEARKIAERELGRLSDRSQQSGETKDLSYWEQQGSLARLFTMFLTSPRQYFTNFAEISADALAGKEGARSLWAKKTAIYVFVLPELFTLFGDLLKHGINFDDWETEDYIFGWLTQTLSGAFFLGPLLEDTANALMKHRYMNRNITPVADIVNDALKVVSKINNDDLAGAIDEGATFISTVFGGAYAPVKRETETWLKFFDVIEKDWTELF